MCGAEAQRVPEEHRADLRASERQAQVPALTRLNRVNREPARDRRRFRQYLSRESRHPAVYAIF